MLLRHLVAILLIVTLLPVGVFAQMATASLSRIRERSGSGRLLVSVAAAVEAAAQQRSERALRVLRPTFVMEEPSDVTDVAGSVVRGELLELVGERGNWYLVRPLPGGPPREWLSGWIMMTNVEAVGRTRDRGTTEPPVVDPPTSALAQQGGVLCDTSRTTGNDDAGDQHGTAGWLLGGVGAGVGLGLIGTGIITGSSVLTRPQPRTVPPGVEEPCYREGYRSRAKQKNVRSSFFGGLIGTGAWLLIYYANSK